MPKPDSGAQGAGDPRSQPERPEQGRPATGAGGRAGGRGSERRAR